MNHKLHRKFFALSVVFSIAISLPQISEAKTKTHTFTLSASDSNFLDTGIDIGKGKSVPITVTGDGTCHFPSASDCAVGPAGSGYLCSASPFGAYPAGPAGDAVPYGAVAGKVGDGNPFFIGAGATATGPGRLYIIYNDCSAPAGYGDNGGSFQVTVDAEEKERNLKIEFSPSSIPSDSSQQSRTRVTASVKDQNGDPISDEVVQIQEPYYVATADGTNPVAKMIACDTSGRRVWPPAKNLVYAFDRVTDAEGKINFSIWAGTEHTSSSVLVAGMLTEVTDTSKETTQEKFTLTGNSGTSVSDTLGAIIYAQAKQNGPVVFKDDGDGIKEDTDAGVQRTGKVFAAGPKDQVVNELLIWLNDVRVNGPNILANVDFGPIHSDSGQVGIVFYPAGNPGPLIKHFETGAEVSADYAFVLPINEVNKDFVPLPLFHTFTGPNPYRPAFGDLPELKRWENTRPADVAIFPQPKFNDGSPPPIPDPAESGARGQAKAGRINAQSGEEYQFFGYPYPAPLGKPDFYQQDGRCLGPSLNQLTAAEFSPIHMLFTNGEGFKTGVDKDGNIIDEIPGSLVTTGNGKEPRVYGLPVDDYSVEVFGADKGKTEVLLTIPGSPGEGLNVTSYSFSSKKGVNGTFSFGPAGASEKFKFGKANVKAQNGIALKIKSLPASFKVAKKPKLAHITVDDQFGNPVFAAQIATSAGVTTLTDANGKANLYLKAPAKGNKLTVTISGSGVKTFTKKIKVIKSKKNN